MTRIEALRSYLFGILDTLTTNEEYQIDADMLGKVGDYSLDKVPIEPIVRTWINGIKIKRDVYSFRSKKAYAQDTITNLRNIGFFEEFENIISYNNRKGILPDIRGILSIECLNCGALNNANTKEAIFNIQIQITYMMEDNNEDISM